MPVRPFLVVLPLALLFLAVPASGEDWSAENWYRHKSGWEGYGVGTMVHRRMTMRTSGPGMPAPMNNVTETRSTLIRITETSFFIKEETKVGGQWTASESEVQRTGRAGTPPQVEELGTEAVTVEGTAYPCRKQRVTWQEAAEPYVAILWNHEEHGVLRMQTESGGQQIAFTVTKLEVSRTVGGTTVACREMEMTGGSMPGKITHLTSLQVPGGTVEMHMNMNQGGMQIENKTELLAFEIK
ncbi:MAG: hypothetical protein ACYTG6_03910 [Planctomycetota bacterium]|jgi:hypothetical protein